MSHTKKKNYALYTLSRLTEYSKMYSGAIVTKVVGATTFGWIPSYYTKEGLISKLAINWYYSRKDKSNAILNNLSTDMSEEETGYTIRETNDILFGHRYLYDYENTYFIAKVVSDGIEALDMSSIKADLYEAIKKVTNKRKNRIEQIESTHRAEQFKFRSGNVPGIGHNKWHRGTYYRIPRLKNVATQNCSCEGDTKEFTKSKYKPKNLPVWDDRVRHNDKSWKSSYKVRKQWMKHLDNHMSTDISNKDLAKSFLEIETDIWLM